MAGRVEPWIVRTQQTLGTLVEKPTMSVKFLSKPPFRFIFDVVAAVAAKTGFGKGLREVCPTDKDEKLQFIIQGIALDDVLDVNPIKVVCGLEPDKTNLLLQSLHAAATTQAHKSEDAVARVLAGEVPGREEPPEELPEEPAAPAAEVAAPAAPVEPAGELLASEEAAAQEEEPGIVYDEE